MPGSLTLIATARFPMLGGGTIPILMDTMELGAVTDDCTLQTKSNIRFPKDVLTMTVMPLIV